MKLFLFGLLAWCLLAAPPEPARHIEDARRAWNVPGVAVAIVKDDQIVYLAGHGLRELGKPEPITPHTTFQIASTTKAFTTTALAILADDGKLTLDDPVRKHLDYFRLSDPHADALVTLRDLVTHRTGLPRHDTLWVRTGWDRENLIRRMAFAKPTASFRSQYQYQNLMFTAAGEAVGKASGLGWDGFLRTRIFGPLGMRETASLYAEMIEHPDRAQPHLKRQGKIAPTPWSNYDNIGGAGSLASSAADMAQWLRLQLGQGVYDGKRIVSAKHLAETHLPNMFNRLTDAQRDLQPDFTQTSYGMGWTINHYRGEMLVMHAGVLSGFRALVTMVPRLKLGLVILANLNGTNLPEALTNTLLDEYLDLPGTRDWNSHMLAATRRAEDKEALEKKKREAKRQRDTRPSLPLAAYAGIYTEPAYGEVTVSLKDANLSLAWARFEAKLDHWHFDTFHLQGSGALADGLASFTLDAEGRPARLNVLGQDFRRAKP